MTVGLSSASFWRISNARRYDSSASVGWPVCDSRVPISLWMSARPLRNSVTAGWSSVSFWRISNARRYDSIASAGRPFRDCRKPMLLWLNARRSAEVGDGGVVLGQLLADLQRPAVRLQRLGRLAGLRLQEADVVVAIRQAAAEVGDGGVGIGQLSSDRQRLAVRLQRLGRLSGPSAAERPMFVVAVRQARCGIR